MSRKRGKGRIARPTAADHAPLAPGEEARLIAEAAAYAASDAEYESFHEAEETGNEALPPPSLEDALFALEAWQDTEKAVEMAAYHKAARRYLGISTPAIDDMVALWRGALDLDGRVDLARGLWDSDIHEARIAAAKLLTQARMRPDDGAWALIEAWVPQFDAWAIADTACKAASRRLMAEPSRLDRVESWLGSENMWQRRAALVATLPWTRPRDPSPDEIAARERVLGWAVTLSPDRDWFIQKAIGWWLRELGKKQPDRVRQWLAEHGDGLKAFARKEAGKGL